ncbi:DNA-binding response regulator [Pontibacter diazotrophicus]|uniref:DNA-binding response regulator n=1 Tax=Pontibacter diazotrophicus TaxID=1400979 RepID=A0A3D8L7I2_9BACT|nr:LytTR family DNA-binding domain-containing protein [Pontibacter diazotrophicus]RDV13371.1 DNA-binding response regulator [Pontibacter diazotrophicus]
MIKCFVVDDEAHNIRLLSDYIEKTPGLELVGAAENPLEALHAITSGTVTPDLVFVDVDMPELSGVDLAGLLNRHTEIVFATAYPDYALQAFEKNALDYLVKPISYERFLQSVSKVRLRISAESSTVQERENTYIFVKSDVKGKMVKVEYEEIVYVEALQNYVKIHTTREPVITHLTMKKVEEGLPEDRFSRVHKSFIVHNAKVRVVEGNQVTLDDKSVVALGSSYRDAFLQKIGDRLLNNGK